MKRHRLAYILLFFAIIAVVASAYRIGLHHYIVHPADGAYVGQTREQIIQQFGTPDGRSPGNYGLPPVEWAQKFEPCETFTYAKWNGILYASVYEKNGQWICYSSTWLPKGAQF